jgi:hypothetical protein
VQRGNEMYVTGEIYTDVLGRNAAHLVHCAVVTADEAQCDHDDVSFEPVADTTDGQKDLEQVIEAKKQDNALIGETLVSIGLLQNHELVRLHTVQAESSDVVGSLLLASAIRSRLGEILLQAKCITSTQLEHALEVQRQSGRLLGEILVQLEWLERDTLDVALAAQTQRKAAAQNKQPGTIS